MKTPVYRRWWFWTLIALVVVCIAVRIVLDPIAAHYTQKGLDEMHGYTSKFESVHVSVIPPGYAVHKLTIRQDDSKLKDPLVYIEELEAQVILRKLLKFQIVALASVKHPKLAIGAGDFEPPKTDTPPKPKKKEEVNVAKTLNDIIPFRVDRFEVRKGQVLFVDATDPEKPQFWVKDLELAVENIASRRSLDQNVPVNLTMSADVAKSGKLTMMANADPLQKLPAFTGQAELKGLNLADVYEFAQAKAGLSPKGTFDCFVTFNSAHGKLSGDIKPMVKNGHIDPADAKVGNVLKAKLANAAISLLSDRVEDRNAVVTVLPIKGTITKPDPEIWPTIMTVLRNAFVEGISSGFTNLPPRSSKEQEDKKG